MLDLKWIRENVEQTRAGLKAKNANIPLDDLLELDQKRRTLLREAEELKARRNQASEEIGRLKNSGQAIADKTADLKALSQKISHLDCCVGEFSLKIDEITHKIPNLPLADVPIALGPTGNKVVRTWGEPHKFDFNVKDHLELAQKNGWVNMDWGSKITGSGFAVYKGQGARLERGLINFMIDLHTRKHGYTEIWSPSLVNRQTMTGTGQLPKMEDDMYRLKDEDYFLIPTAEVPITNLMRDEILEEAALPIKFTGYTPCFRREAGSYGKDTRGLSRLHQFDKVELVKFAHPSRGEEELQDLLGHAEAVLQALELPYRVVLLGSGDMSFAAAKCYDLEAWAPGTQKWFEVSSCSLFGDFQARRANIRFRPKGGKKPEYVYTLNGSGLALARIVLCLMESGQNANGDIQFPPALRPYVE